MVKFITYEEKQYPVRVSYYALKMIQAENKGKEGSDVLDMKDFNPEMQEALLYHSLVSGARAIKQDLTIPRGDMEKVLDECWMEFLQLIPEFFPKKGEEGSKKE